MARFPTRHRTCERAQAWASLELDDELSQIERALLAAHLARCEECAASVRELRAVTHALRATPLERPERPLFEPRASVPRRRAPALAARIAIAATLVALAAGLGVVVGSIGRDAPPPPAPGVSDIALLPNGEDVRDLGRPRGGQTGFEDDQRLPRGRFEGV